MDSILEQLKSIKKPIIGCFPLYPPLELLHSMGFFPIILWDFRKYIKKTYESDKHIQDYACSVARYLIEFILEDKGEILDGILVYNACDTLRNTPEIIADGLTEKDVSIPIFKFHIPMIQYHSDYSRSYLKNEILNLIHELETTFHKKHSPDEFTRSVKLYKKFREFYSIFESYISTGSISFGQFSNIIQRNQFNSVEDQIEILESHIEELKSPIRSPYSNCTKKVILSGITPPPLKIIEAIEASGLTIVGNDIALMHRSNCYISDVDGGPADYYLDFYKNHFPCTTLLYTADSRINAILNLMKERKADGLIYIGEKFCEYEYFEIPYLKKILKNNGYKVLSLEFAIGDNENIEISSYKTRIEAFSELIK